MKSLNDVGILVRQGWRVVLIAVWGAIVGCGGGGGPAAGDLPAGRLHVKDSGSVSVIVTDALGDPVAGAEVYFNPYRGDSPRAFTDADGRAAFAEVQYGELTVLATMPPNAGRGPAYGQHEFVLKKDQHLDVDVVTRPGGYAEPFAVASIDTGSIAADRRSLEVSVRVVGDFWPGSRFHLRECEPSTDNDAPQVQSDCVEGPSGFDAAYAGVPAAEAPLTPDTGPLTVAILLDQSGRTLLSDPYDMRLFAIKYFLTKLGAEDRVVLAAFSSDDVRSGQRSLLPEAPLTVYPADNPRFLPSDRGLFETVDSLAALQGGAAPLYAALGKLLDFVASRGPSDGRRVVVVFTDGPDDTCGSALECQGVLRAVIDKSRATRATVYTVSVSNGPHSVSQGLLGRLVAGNGGAAQWVHPAEDPTFISGQLGDLLKGRARVWAARFRIESPVDRAFEQGRTLLGTVWTEDGDGWGNEYETEVPFAVGIP